MGNDVIKNAYFAGLIDGEGSIGLICTGPKKRYRLAPTISIGMTDRLALDALSDYFGGVPAFRRRPREHWSDCWHWKATEARARIVLWHIYPHLITKRCAADALIDHWRKSGLWTDDGPVARGGWLLV